MKYYAHSKKDEAKDNWQTIKEHLEGTAKRAESFAQGFNAQELAHYIGLLHDIGKYTKAFQKRLKGGKRVDHSTAGAKEAFEIFGNSIGKLMSYCIACHHGGLRDWGNYTKDEYLEVRLKKEIDDEYKVYEDEISIEAKQILPSIKQYNKNNPYYSISFLIKMLYSCLVDADFLDTEKFMNPEKADHRLKSPELKHFYEKLKEKLNKFEKDNSEINKIRNSVLSDCQKAGKEEKGLYSLTVPTGGGKTLSSMAFALEHCIKHNMKRVIYVIPYTSIIEQNADVFRQIFGDEYVLEHHSNYLFEDKDYNDDEYHEDNLALKLKLASENWDIPIVTTTNVQFFESLYANKSSRCRKLHNIANSVIILDEAQMLPRGYLNPCLLAISELITNYGCTVVLCTATQPAISDRIKKLSNLEVKEIISNPDELYEKLTRVKIEKIQDKLSDDELSAQLLDKNKVLCIVNTRKHAKNLYNKIKKGHNAFHLSTLMCPKHRRKVIQSIKTVLQNNKSDCRVISTQLIEAGVDVDFPVVYRASAGIDSIAQSSGRCNREGKLKTGGVKIFDTSEDYGKVQGWLARTADVGDEVIRHHDDILSLKAVKSYFENLYSLDDESCFDKKGIIELLNNEKLEFSFKTAAKEFKLMQDNQKSIIVPFDDRARELIEMLENIDFDKKIYRELSQYAVNVYEKEYEALENNGALKPIADSFVVLVKDELYEPKEGLIIPDGSEVLMV